VIVFRGDVAEDAVQDAFAIAPRKWPAEGLPPNPDGGSPPPPPVTVRSTATALSLVDGRNLGHCYAFHATDASPRPGWQKTRGGQLTSRQARSRSRSAAMLLRTCRAISGVAHPKNRPGEPDAWIVTTVPSGCRASS
jgi:hypothetical protein